MVIELKLWCKRLGKLLIEYAMRIIDTWSVIISFLQEMAFKAFGSFKKLAEQFSLELESYVERLEDIDCVEKQKYSFVRSIGKAYRPNFGSKVIYHRCRDRC